MKGDYIKRKKEKTGKTIKSGERRKISETASRNLEEKLRGKKKYKKINKIDECSLKRYSSFSI